MNKIKAIIFDLDGVLIDAKEWHYDALNRALKIFGYEISRHEHLSTYDGLPTKRKLEILSSEQGLPLKLHDLINNLKQNLTFEMIVTNCKPVFHHQYAISKLKGKGYGLAVASNSVRASVEAMLERSSLLSYFDFYLSNQDVQKSKPSPEIYLKAIQRFNLQSSECLIVEDNPVGLAAAVATGAHVLQVNSVDEVNFQNISLFINSCENK